jgi:hypothetical protein
MTLRSPAASITTAPFRAIMIGAQEFVDVTAAIVH